ncbi:hypothetical protein KUTeg_021502 [Tegillarca granosa]|uniref:Matrin-type domain-containing protein n=1 Tax=Tegillarca granosa TaxID=220873 RepID=A0ABQ9E9K1_TEGGR|nr:hypothetical protein KUTeg_021502 [Tegillarca granosa]
MADAEDVDEKKDDMDTSDTSLTVTIDKSGRSVNDPQRKKSDSESDGKKTNFYCHACAVDCRNETSFTNHMKGNRHRDRMNMLLNLHQKKSYELADRMKAEEHLRKIEGKPRPDYCRTCDIKFDGTFQQHRQTREHKKKVEKEKLHGKEHSDEEDEEFPDNFVTVDTIGYDDDDVNMDADGGKKLGKFKVDIDFVIPDYDPQKPLGQNFIVPVTGYFCKLCHKFYNNEQAAKVTHCQSEPHYDKFQKMMLAKKLSQKMEKEKQSADIKEEQKVDIQEEQKDSTETANEKNNTESNQSATTETSQSKTTNGSIDQSENGETEIKVEETGEAEEKAEEDVTMDTNVDTSVAEEEHEEEEDVSPKSKAKGSTRGRGKQRARRGKKV